ncbi:unnamed protein product [Notodromas monacha]|uniref:Uncharacterized protein n=1 Tax=Notodromas monacha TaxID=399045 RepID=A0A7R9BJI8_9CRUS|nr:unnamed protein product [Notodromas monacha]CAG0915276.1 unnamed protein product [Notodromas monacha]
MNMAVKKIPEEKQPMPKVEPFGNRNFLYTDLIPGTHALVQFTINQKKYTRVCVIIQEPDEDGDVAVVKLRCLNETQRFFYIDSQDAIDVKFEQIVETYPSPEVFPSNGVTHFYYAQPIEVFEEGFNIRHSK